MARNHKSGQGFTLIELIVVLVIIGLLSGFVMPRVFGTLTHVELKSAARDTVTFLQQARDLAYYKKKYTRVSFALDTGQIIISSYNKIDELREKSLSGTLWEWVPIKEKTYAKSIKIEQCKKNDGTVVTGRFEIVFYPAGNGSGGQIVLKNSKGRTFMIRVNPITGESRIIDEKETDNG